MYIFRLNRENTTSVQITLPNEDAPLTEVIEAFSDFLLGVGFDNDIIREQFQ